MVSNAFWFSPHAVYWYTTYQQDINFLAKISHFFGVLIMLLCPLQTPWMINEMNSDQLWQAALGELEVSLTKAHFTTWFKNTFVAESDGRRVVVGVPNGFTKAWLESKYHTDILKALQNASQKAVEQVEYRVEARQRTPVTSVEPPRVVATPETSRRQSETGLDPNNTFEHFVVGKGNELARAAARAVVDQPGQVYNPLFIYGGVGLGKTHLIHAIGNEILAHHPNKRVLYVSSERFTNEFIQAVSRGGAEKFKNFYRGVDALLIDDIQFLSGKEGTQEEFFHTFNALHQARKQIVITSDRPPKSISSLEARLLSRFEWGMIADIAQPDLETRTAILEAKCRERGRALDPQIVAYVASVVQSNIRELEGALNRLLAYHSLNQTEPTLESAQSLLASLAQAPRRGGITPKQLIQTVASFFGLTVEDLTGVSRKKELVEPRQVAMYLMREELRSSYPSIGNELGGRDHTTAMHACTKIINQLSRDEKLKQDVALLRQQLYSV